METNDTAVFSPHLLPGEQIVWSGRPNPDELLVRADRIWIPLGLIAMLFALAAFIASIVTLLGAGSGGALVGFLVALALGATGFHLMIGRVAQRRKRFLATEYAITDRRALMLQIAPALDIPKIELKEAALAASDPKLVNQIAQRGDIAIGRLLFENVDDAPVVFEILSGQIAAARQG